MRAGGFRGVHELVEHITAACPVEGDNNKLRRRFPGRELGHVEDWLWLVFGSDATTIARHGEIDIGVA